MAAGFERLCGGEQRWVVRRGAEQRRGSSSSARTWAEQPELVSRGGARAKARRWSRRLGRRGSRSRRRGGEGSRGHAGSRSGRRRRESWPDRAELGRSSGARSLLEARQWSSWASRIPEGGAPERTSEARSLHGSRGEAALVHRRREGWAVAACRQRE